MSEQTEWRKQWLTLLPTEAEPFGALKCSPRIALREACRVVIFSSWLAETGIVAQRHEREVLDALASGCPQLRQALPFDLAEQVRKLLNAHWREIRRVAAAFVNHGADITAGEIQAAIASARDV